MDTIKTTAIVEDASHLKLATQLDFLTKGTLVEVYVLIKPRKSPSNWQQILNQIGVYDEEELAGIYEVRKEMSKWKPTEF